MHPKRPAHLTSVALVVTALATSMAVGADEQAPLATMAPPAASAPSADAMAAYPLPPPPGPYVSSTPMLPPPAQQMQAIRRQMLTQHHQYTAQFERDNRPYSGPGRYWSDKDWRAEEKDDSATQVATAPATAAPWGTPPVHETAAVQPAPQWQPMPQPYYMGPPPVWRGAYSQPYPYYPGWGR